MKAGEYQLTWRQDEHGSIDIPLTKGSPSLQNKRLKSLLTPVCGSRCPTVSRHRTSGRYAPKRLRHRMTVAEDIEISGNTLVEIEF